MNFPELEQHVLSAVGMGGRKDVSGVTIHFAPQEAPLVIVSFLVAAPSEGINLMLDYIEERYTLVPKELPAAPESAQ